MASVVWLKRDLRLADHSALAAAVGSGLPLVVLYVYEPSLCAAHDCGAVHIQFINDSLAELRAALEQRGGRLVLRHGEAAEVLAALHATELPAAGVTGGIAQLWSHEETGTPAVTARNAAVAAWAQERGVAWTELPQTGVLAAAVTELQRGSLGASYQQCGVNLRRGTVSPCRASPLLSLTCQA